MTASRLESLALEGAARRVRHDLSLRAEETSFGSRWWVLPLALALFMGGFALRLSVDDPGALVANFYTVPIALIAIMYGLRAGLVAAGFALMLVWAWGQIDDQHVGVLGYSTRGAVFLLVAALVGWYAEALRMDIAERHAAERELALRAGELELANAELTRAVMRLEAFAEIARSVGGETELRTVLDRILEHGRAIVEGRTLVVYLDEDGQLVAAASTGAAGKLPDRGDVETIAATPGTVVVPLRWRGDTLGALAAEGAPGDETRELLESVAASAAAAVATAKSVAADRLHHTIQASEEARARWARELHDETLQGLVGLRMLLASARRSGSAGELNEAIAQTRREIVNLRALIAELRPAALDELGLEAAIETLAERSAAATGIAVETNVALEGGGVPRLSNETETTVYRLVQEALTNAARHAAAGAVRVVVREVDGQIAVSVADDGRGFDPTVERAGFGLTGMRERVQLAGGRISIRSAPNDGSVVEARLPARRVG